MLFPTLRKTIITLAASVMLAVGVTTMAQNADEVSGINLDQLQKSGYRIDWINQPTSKGLRLPTITKDSFYTVDNSDFVSKYDIDSGKWLWSTPVGNQTYKIKGITEIKNLKRTYVLSEQLLVITLPMLIARAKTIHNFSLCKKLRTLQQYL